MNDFHAVAVKRQELQKVLDSFDVESEYVHFAIELDSIKGDQILWVDNGKFGNNRAYIRINKTWKFKEREENG